MKQIKTSTIIFRIVGIVLMMLIVQQLGSGIVGLIHYIVNSDLMELVQENPELAQDQQWLMEHIDMQQATKSIAGIGLAVASLVFVLLMRLSRMSEPDYHSANWQCVLWGILLVIPLSVVSNVVTELMNLEDVSGGMVQEVMHDPWGIASIAVLGPIAEEVCFRSGILGYFLRLSREYNNPRLIMTGLVTQAVLFGVIHLNPPQVAFGTVMGLMFGWVYFRTGSIIPCIVMHVINNSAAVVLELTQVESDSFIAFLGGPTVAAMICCVCVTCLWLLLTRYSYYPSEQE